MHHLQVLTRDDDCHELCRDLKIFHKSRIRREHSADLVEGHHTGNRKTLVCFTPARHCPNGVQKFVFFRRYFRPQALDTLQRYAIWTSLLYLNPVVIPVQLPTKGLDPLASQPTILWPSLRQ